MKPGAYLQQSPEQVSRRMDIGRWPFLKTCSMSEFCHGMIWPSSLEPDNHTEGGDYYHLYLIDGKTETQGWLFVCLFQPQVAEL